MISKQLLNYIEKEDKLGKSKNEVEDILISAGWHKDAVSEAFDIYYKKDVADKGLTPAGPQRSDLYKTAPLELESPHDMLLEDGDTDGIKKVEISVIHENNGQVSGTEKTVESEENIAPKSKVAEEDKKPKDKVKKRRVRPIFLIILSFVLGVAVMFAISIFFLNKSTETAEVAPQKATGFEAQKIDDGKRIVEVLKIQEALEKYYDGYKSYPENINSLIDIPEVSSELNYAYTSIGSPPQSYILNIEMKNTNDGEFKVDGGFMTLKNKQGTK